MAFPAFAPHVFSSIVINLPIGSRAGFGASCHDDCFEILLPHWNNPKRISVALFYQTTHSQTGAMGKSDVPPLQKQKSHHKNQGLT
jgi:hypothetical protein